MTEPFPIVERLAKIQTRFGGYLEQWGPLKWVPIVFAAVLAYAIGQTLMNLFTCWSAETKASVWVAIGTLALALVTAWSIYQTRAIVAAEDKRHMQTFVPLAIVSRGLTYHTAQNLFSIAVVNNGKAPLLNLRIELTGEANLQHINDSSLRFHSVLNETMTLSALEERNPQKVFLRNASVPGLPDYGLPENAWNASATLRYTDIFGNEFITGYADLTKLNEYHFAPPPIFKLGETPQNS